MQGLLAQQPCIPESTCVWSQWQVREFLPLRTVLDDSAIQKQGVKRLAP